MNVWLNIAISKLYVSSFFAKQSITDNIYLKILELLLESQLLGTVLFQHDDTPPHFEQIVHYYLNRTSKGITMRVFLYMGVLQSKVYTRKVKVLLDLRNRMKEVAGFQEVYILKSMFQKSGFHKNAVFKEGSIIICVILHSNIY